MSITSMMPMAGASTTRILRRSPTELRGPAARAGNPLTEITLAVDGHALTDIRSGAPCGGSSWHVATELGASTHPPK